MGCSRATLRKTLSAAGSQTKIGAHNCDYFTGYEKQKSISERDRVSSDSAGQTNQNQLHLSIEPLPQLQSSGGVAMGTAPVVIILAAIGVCLVLAAHVYTGRLHQKGPH